MDADGTREAHLIRIDLGTTGLSQTRFAISPLHAAAELLYFRARVPQAIPRPWRAATDEAVGDGQLNLLIMLARDGAYGYMPDFLIPSPARYEGDVDAELHQVATTPAHRVTYEMRNLLDGISWSGQRRTRPVSSALLAVIERGEQGLAEKVAGQLAQLWEAVLAPQWPRIVARLEDDIAHRSHTIAREGFAAMARALHPTVDWVHGGLNLQMRYYQGHASAGTAILVPAAFGHMPLNVIDPVAAPDYRTPLIGYPAMSPVPFDAAPLDELIGSTRAQLLAHLAEPRTTEQLARRLHLSRSTVSYHLQVLLRAGVVCRVRRSRYVYYHASSPESGLLGRLTETASQRDDRRDRPALVPSAEGAPGGPVISAGVQLPSSVRSGALIYEA
jgi:DNA-binding transcriptional ArsR family regulator